MKIVYLTSPGFFDLDISFIRELSRIADVRVLLYVAPMNMKASAFSLNSQLEKEDIIPSTDYPGMEQYDNLIERSRWYIVNDTTNFSFSTCLKLNRRILRFVDDFNPDIFHIVETSRQKGLLFAMMKRGKRRMLLSLHDVIYHAGMSSIRAKINCTLRNIGISKIHNILLYSKIFDQELENQLKKIPHSVYYSMLGPYDFLTHYPNEENKYGEYVLFFGRIDYYKGVDILIESYQKSTLSEMGIKLILAGRDICNATLEVNNESIIVLNRYIENVELANLIRHSLFVVLPYRTATQSGVTKSAFAMNKPILCTDAGNLPFEVLDGKYGHVVKAENVDAMTQGLNWMIMNRDGLSVFADNIREDWNNSGPYSWKVIASELVKNVYEKL